MASTIIRPDSIDFFRSPRNEIQLGRKEYCDPTSAVSPLYMYSSAEASASLIQPVPVVVALAVLMPVVASMGGNAGTQTLAVAVRALAARELNAANALRLVALAAIWGASFLLMKLGAAEFGPFVTAFLRVFLASLFLLPLLLWQRQMSALRARLGPILLVGMLNSGLPFALYGFAVLHITTGLSAILNATVPLWGALVAWAWLGDRPNGSRMLGLVIGFVGVAALAWDKASFSGVDPMSGLAVLACLMATLLYGISASFTKKYLSNTPAMASAARSFSPAAPLTSAARATKASMRRR